MSIFLKAKHWQLFLLFFGIPLLLEVFFMANVVINVSKHRMVNMSADLIVFPIMMLLFMGTLFCWFWAVATGLQQLIPAGVKMKVTKFKVFFFIPIVYLVFLMGGIGFLFTGNMNHLNPGPFFAAFAIIFPLHLFSMFCIFYCLYFVAKTIKTIELQRAVGFGDFAGEFFLTWFFFVGVWILQPKINQMIYRQENPGPLTDPNINSTF